MSLLPKDILPIPQLPINANPPLDQVTISDVMAFLGQYPGLQNTQWWHPRCYMYGHYWIYPTGYYKPSNCVYCGKGNGVTDQTS